MHGKYFGFGATSVLTDLAVIVGLSGTVNPAVSIVTDLTIIANADNISDSFGMHVHEESQKESVKDLVATEQKAAPSKIILRHLLLTVLVIGVNFLFRELSSGLIAEFVSYP
jgi:hypothetical protein